MAWHSTRVNTADEQDISRIADFRESRFERWADDLDNELATSIKSRFNDGISDSIRVTDDCLFYNSGGAAPTSEQAQRIVVLLVLLTGKQRGSGVELDRLAAQINQSVETIRDWIIKYFDPAGVPVTLSETTAWLSTSVRYESHRFESVSALSERAGLIDSPVQKEHPVKTLASIFEQVFNQSTEQTIEAVRCPIEFYAQLEEPGLTGGDSRSVEEFIRYKESAQSEKEEYSLCIPAPSSEALRRPFHNSVKHLLESPAKTSDISKPEWELGHLFRERYRYMGAVPLFTASNPNTLTTFGTHIQEEGIDQAKLRCLLFAANPIIRHLVVLVGMNSYTVRKEGGAWRLIQDDISKPLLAGLSQLIRASTQAITLVTPVRVADEVAGQLVSLAEKVGIIKRDPVTQSLDIPHPVLDEFTEHRLLDWHDRIETELRNESIKELEA